MIRMPYSLRRLIHKIVAIVLSVDLFFCPGQALQADSLAPNSSLRDSQTKDDFIAAATMVSTQTSPDDARVDPFPSAIPIYRKGKTTSDGKRLAHGKFGSDGKWIALQDPNNVVTPSIQAQLHEVMKAFHQQDPGYRTLTHEIKFTVVDSAHSLVRLNKRIGQYEIVVDKALLQIGARVDLQAFLKLLFNHELHHALLRENDPSRETDPILEEAAVLASDLLFFSQVNVEERNAIVVALDALSQEGFLSESYKKFLLGFIAAKYPQDKGVEAFLHEIGDEEGVAKLFGQCLRMATHPEGNAKYSRHLSEMQYQIKRILGENWDMEKAIHSHDYRGVARKLRAAIKSKRFLAATMAELDKALLEPLAAYDEALNRLFERFVVKVYKVDGIIDAEVEKKILKEDLPRIAKLGGQKVLKRLEDLLGFPDYSITLREAMARTILEVGGDIYPVSVTNAPFLREALVPHSRYLRSRGYPRVLGIKSLKYLFGLLNLLGHASVESRELYLDIRSELVSWLLVGQQSMRACLNPKTKRPWLKDKAQFQRAKMLVELAEKMLVLHRDNLKEMLGAEGWSGKLVYKPKKGDPLFTQADDEEVGDLHEKEGDEELAKLAVESMRMNQDTNVLRESIFLLYGKIVEGSPEDLLTMEYEGRGDYKFVYHLHLRTKDGDEYDIARNFILQPKSECVENAKKLSGMGFSRVRDEINRLCLLSHPIYERIAGDWEYADHVIWDEEYVKGRSLDPDLSHSYLVRPQGQSLEAWMRLVKRAVREYSKTCWIAWDREGRNHTDLDINLWNLKVMPDKSMRFIDAGHLVIAGKDPVEVENNPVQYLVRMMVKIKSIYERYPELDGLEDSLLHDQLLSKIGDQVGDELGKLLTDAFFTQLEELQDLDNMRDIVCCSIYDGILDALGQREGLTVLKQIYAKSRSKETGATRIRSLGRYLKSYWMKYVPPAADLVITPAQKEELMKNPSRFQCDYFFAHGLNNLRQSPWLWAYLSRRIMVERLGGEANVPAQDRKMLLAFDKLIEKLRHSPGFSGPEKTAQCSQWMAGLARRLKLDAKQAEALQYAVSYRVAVSKWLDDRMGRLLVQNGYDANSFLPERQELVGIVTKAVMDPVIAAAKYHDALRHHETGKFLYALATPKGRTGAAVLVSAAYEQILRGLVAERFLDRENLLAMLRHLPIEDLGPFMHYDVYPEMMREFLIKDYKRVTRTYEAIIQGDADRAAEFAAFSLEERKDEQGIMRENMGYQGIAYILDACQETQTRMAWVNALVGWKDVQGQWHRLWNKARVQGADRMKRWMLPRAAKILARYDRIDHLSACALLMNILLQLGPGAAMRMSFIGKKEITDSDGHRLEDLVCLLRHLPTEMWDGALRTMHPAAAAKALTAYHEALIAMEAESEKASSICGGTKVDAAALNKMQEAFEEGRVLRAQRKELRALVARHHAHKPGVAHRIVAGWLRLERLSEDDFQEILESIPEDAVRAGLLEIFKSDPEGRLFAQVLNLKDTAQQELIYSILRGEKPIPNPAPEPDVPGTPPVGMAA